MTSITLIAILIVGAAALLYLYVKFIDFLVWYRKKKEKINADILKKMAEEGQDFLEAQCAFFGHDFRPYIIKGKYICICCGQEDITK